MAVIWPGYACQFAAMGAGAAFDVFVCRPAEDKYLSTVRLISQNRTFDAVLSNHVTLA